MECHLVACPNRVTNFPTPQLSYPAHTKHTTQSPKLPSPAHPSTHTMREACKIPAPFIWVCVHLWVKNVFLKSEGHRARTPSPGEPFRSPLPRPSTLLRPRTSAPGQPLVALRPDPNCPPRPQNAVQTLQNVQTDVSQHYTLTNKFFRAWPARF